MPFDVSNSSNGMAFVLATGAVWECIAFACSSPQTLQHNIKVRGEDAMYWVHMGQGLSALTIGIGAALQKKTRFAIIAGGAFGMISAEMFYLHAKTRGYSKPGTPTEQWGPEEGGFVYDSPG